MPRCDNCGGRLDRPGLFGCQRAWHPEPSLADRIVAAIEEDLRDRRGLRRAMKEFDQDTQDEIRRAWVAIVAGTLESGEV